MILPLFDQWCIRNFEMRDAESLARYANNRNVWINVRDSFPYPYSLHDARRFLSAHCDRQHAAAWAISSATEAIGAIGLHPQPDVYRLSSEVGYWLGEPFWGKGIATAAVKAMVDYAFRETEAVRIFAGVFEWNARSARVLKKAGFSLESRMRKSVVKDGMIIDQLMYVLLREEWVQQHSQREENNT